MSEGRGEDFRARDAEIQELGRELLDEMEFDNNKYTKSEVREPQPAFSVCVFAKSFGSAAGFILFVIGLLYVVALGRSHKDVE